MKIYKIENTSNGKVYIGQTSQALRERLLLHKSLLKRNKHHNTILQEDWNATSGEGFVFELIEEVQSEFSDQRERDWIQKHASNHPETGYNKNNGGKKGFEVSSETKLKIGLMVTSEKNGFFKRKHSKESIAKMLESRPVKQKRQKTYIRSISCRTRQSAAALRRVYTDSQLDLARTNGKVMSKPVKCNENGIIYESRSEMARQLNITRSNISAVIKGKKKSVSGYTFTEMSN